MNKKKGFPLLWKDKINPTLKGDFFKKTKAPLSAK